MPNYSSISITFNQDLILDNSFGFTASSPTPNSILQYVGFRMVNVRFQEGQVAIGSPTLVPGERTAINFLEAFTADWINGSSLYAATINQNTVTIYAQIDTLDFSGTFSFNDYLEFPATLNGNVSFDINNFSGSPYFIESIEYEEATENPACTHYRVKVTTSLMTDNFYLQHVPDTTFVNIVNPFYFERERGFGFKLTCETNGGQIDLASRDPGVVPALIPDNVTVNIANSPLGATVTVYAPLTNSGSNSYEYSLNGTDWQTSNVFPGILDGNFTAHVRSLGCTRSLDFIVNNETNIVEPYHYFSKANSFRMALRQDISPCGVLRNEENSLSYEGYAVDPNLARCEHQLFQSCDSPTNQFRSNFSNVSVNIIRPGEASVEVPVIQMTQNIGRKDSRDATRYNVGSGQTGVYFTSGNLYDYDTGADQGEDYILNGGLPEYARIGNWISIGSAYHQIQNIIFDEDLNVDVIVIDEIYLGNPETIIVKAIFNRQKYEVFEFTTILGVYNNKTIQVEIVHEDDNFDTVRYLSEYLNIKTKHENTSKIDYWGESNTDIFYKTGIRNIIRLPLIRKDVNHLDDSEILKGDSRSNLISSEVYEGDDFTFGLMTPGIYRKAVQALSHKFVLIDNIPRVKEGSIEKEGPLEESNLMLIKANMLKSNAPFRSNVSGSDPDISFNEEGLEVANAIITGDADPINY